MFLFSKKLIWGKSLHFSNCFSPKTARDGREQIYTHTHHRKVHEIGTTQNSQRDSRKLTLCLSLRLSFFRNRLLQEAFNNNQQTSFFPKSGGRLFIRYKKFVKCINTHARTQTDNMSETRKEQDDDDMERVAAFGSSGSQRDGKPDEV